MKRITLSMIFACCTLILAAQETIQVNYQGSRPTISDFAGAYLLTYVYDEDGDDCLDEARSAMKHIWAQYLKGKPLGKGNKITVDQKNGYVGYESKDEYSSENDILKIEMCYWNESDGKHKLFAYNVSSFRNGKCYPGQFDGIIFYRYNNATKKMVYCDDPFNRVESADGAWISYSLPRVGKDITVNYWYESGKKQKLLKWNGRRFSF